MNKAVLIGIIVVLLAIGVLIFLMHKKQSKLDKDINTIKEIFKKNGHWIEEKALPAAPEVEEELQEVIETTQETPVTQQTQPNNLVNIRPDNQVGVQTSTSTNATNAAPEPEEETIPSDPALRVTVSKEKFQAEPSAADAIKEELALNSPVTTQVSSPKTNTSSSNLKPITKSTAKLSIKTTSNKVTTKKPGLKSKPGPKPKTNKPQTTKTNIEPVVEKKELAKLSTAADAIITKGN